MRRDLSRKGFTFIELVLVIAIGTTLATVSLISIYQFKAGKDLELSLNEVTAAVRDTRVKSVTQENGERWGIRFTNSATTSDSYEIFSGLNYSTSGVFSFRSLRGSVEFVEPSDGEIVDLKFEPITGEIENTIIISLISTGLGGKVGDIIVSKLGKITSQIEDG